jgi:putative chitinase
MTDTLITTASLIASGVGPTQAKLFEDPLAEACRRFGIEGPKRTAAFLSQALHESANLTRMEENLFYSTPERIRQVFPGRVKTLDDARTLTRNPQALANRVYSGRLGNGDELSGQGWKYRGRGIFQLTGWTNYDMATREIGIDYVNNPDMVAMPIHACLTAANFWVSRGCNELADMGDMASITKRINGPAMLGMNERAAIYLEVLEALA